MVEYFLKKIIVLFLGIGIKKIKDNKVLLDRRLK